MTDIIQQQVMIKVGDIASQAFINFVHPQKTYQQKLKRNLNYYYTENVKECERMIKSHKAWVEDSKRKTDKAYVELSKYDNQLNDHNFIPNSWDDFMAKRAIVEKKWKGNYEQKEKYQTALKRWENYLQDCLGMLEEV